MTTGIHVNDRELLSAYAAGRSADAFAELVRRYSGLVYNVGLRLTRNRDDAQDVTQECFLQLASHAADILQPVPAWLHTLARSRSIDLTRRRRARAQREQQVVPARNSALSLEEWGILSARVDEAIERLPDELRACLVESYFSGRTQQELAADLGVAQGTVSRRIEKGVEALREELRRMGVDIPAAGFVAALTELVSPAAPPAGVIAELTKIGLSGVSKAAARRGLAWLAIGTLLLAVAGVGYWTMRSTFSQPGPALMTDSSTPETSAQNVRTRIDGLRPGAPDTNPYSQGLAILLRHAGAQDATYERVMGYSGVAFALQMDLSGPIMDGKYDVAWWPNDSYAFDLRVDFVGRAFGREIRHLRADPNSVRVDAQREYQTSLEPAIIGAINRGLPVLGQQDSAVLITGYDATTHKPILLWPSPGQPAFGPSDDGVPWGIYVPGKSLEPLPQGEAELESLRWAIALWEEKATAAAKDWDASNIVTGSRAYATWLELLQQQAHGVGLGRDSWDNNLIYHLRYNREAAILYLRDVASRHPGAVAGHLRAASDLYERVADEAARAPLWGQFEANPEVRPAKLQEYTAIIRQAAAWEAEAIEEIRKAIEKW